MSVQNRNRSNKSRRKGNSNTASGRGEFSGQSSFGKRSEMFANIRGIPLFPARYKGLLRYFDALSITTTSGAVASYVYSANGLYDPDISGTGHQPSGFDQMMLSYEHYCCVKSRCFVQFLNTSASTYPTVAISHRAASTPLTIASQQMEDGLLEIDKLYPTGVYGSLKSLNVNADIAKFGGLVKILDNTDYRGNISANPTEQSYFHIQAWSTTATTSTVVLEIILEYEAWFTEPRTLSASQKSALVKHIKADITDADLVDVVCPVRKVVCEQKASSRCSHQ